MHQAYNMDRSSETKQVKIDNWGTFFLQRLQHFFNRTDFCDLTLQFVDNVQLKVHRLVLNTCTEYFQLLENSCDVIDDCLIMPMDLQMDVVVPIVNFMYTGQLEFQLQNYDKLYAAAKLMNLTVLTKLLDAQKVPKPAIKRPPPNNVSWKEHGKKQNISRTPETELPETLPGRKLPVWKRKTAPHNSVRPKLEPIIPERLLGSTKAMPIQHSQDNTPRPTRFEWPEDDSLSEMTSSFDDISYDSTPLATPVKTSTASLSSSIAFEELQKTSRGVKRTPQEQVIENEEADYLDLNESSSNEYVPRAEASRSDNHEDGNSSVQQTASDETDQSILKPPVNEEEQPPSKKVRFSLEGKENVKKPRKQIIEAKVKLDGADLSDHTKIISELLKKYPHLVNKNKNIKLKIMQKNSNDPKDKSKSSTPIKVVVKDLKPDNDASTSEKEDPPTNPNELEWTCKECSIPNDYIQIKSYPEFHEHLVEFHPDQIDPKVCELCGYKSARRHLLLYHQLIKHDVSPPPQFNFPRCERCDYIAINGTALRKHGAQHEIEIKCEICNATFNTNASFLKHCHERGHNFDCAYCEKKFVHSEFVKIHMTNFHKDKINQTNPQSIKILSNVPITGPIEELYPENSQVRLATPSSEAEALVNVASGIAASLGLVVMNDNRQYVLQSNEQDEYIIPEMTEEHLLNETHESIIVSEQSTIMQQGNIVTTSNSLTTMTSTDELVMVLTDHDYSDANNQLISSDNSNIVVLYSHPVEGCSNTTQYISAEGNIVLNSETGVIEMNGQKLAVANTDQLTINDIEQTTENNETISVTEIPPQNEESIELIQQEIHGTPLTSNETNEESENIIQSEINTPAVVENTIEVAETNEAVDGVCAEPEPMEVDLEITPPVVEEHCFKKPLDPKLPPKEKEEIKRKGVKVLLPVKGPEKTEAESKTDEKLNPDEELKANENLNVDENLKSVGDTGDKVVEEKTDEVTAVEDISSGSLPDPTPMDVDEIDAKLAKIKDMVGEETSFEKLVESEEAAVESTAELVTVEKEEHPEATEENNEAVAPVEISDDSKERNETENHIVNEGEEPLENKSEEDPDNSIELSKSDEPNQIQDQELDEPEVTESTAEVTEPTAEENSPLDSTEDSIPDDIEAKLRSLHQTDSEDTQESIDQPPPPESTKETLLTDLSSTLPSSDDSGDGPTNETPKIEVKELVSDWCDEEPQASPKEGVKPVPERVSDQNMKKSKPKKTVKTSQTKALLKDWDDGDTDGDSQTSDDQPATNNPINNLIDDWADDD